MATKTPEMSGDFARWYTQEFMDDGAIRDARWKAVVAMAAGADWWRIEVLVRLAFGAKDPGGHKNEKLATAYAAILAAVRAGDQSFDPIKSARELQVLSAATLVRLFATKADAALTVTTASFGGHRKIELPMDIAALAERALTELTARQHKRPELTSLEMKVPEIDYDSEAEVPEGEAARTPTEQLNALRDAVGEAFENVVERQNELTSILVRRMQLGEEELQMLWWLIGAYSSTENRSFSKVATAALPLVLASELGVMTTVSPGPAGIRAILGKAGVAGKPTAVRDAVNAVDLEWGRKVSQPAAVSAVTTPLHFALEKRAEVDGDAAWQASWAALTGLSADVALPAVQLAELFYREHLFLRVSG